MRRYEKWLPLVVVIAGALAYANSFAGVFLFDDSVIITSNPGISTLPSFAWRTRILCDLSFRINYLLGGLNGTHFHAVNLLIHICAGLFLFGIIRRMLVRPFFADRYKEPWWLAVAVAVLWLVHPLQTGSVTYICQRYESMMGLCFLGAFYCCIRAYGSCMPYIWGIIAAIIFIAGLGAKEVIVVFPVVLLVYDHVIESGALRKHLFKHRILALLLVVALIVIGSPIIKLAAFHLVQYGGRGGVSPWMYFCTQWGVITHYLRLSVFPYPLCLDYAWPPVASLVDALLPCLFVCFMAIATLCAVCRRFAIGFAGVWFFVILVPTSSVFPLPDMVFEHRMYLPLVAVVSVLVFGCHHIAGLLFARLDTSKRVRVGLYSVFLVCIAVLFTVLTALRNEDYRSESTMWQKALKVSPYNLRAMTGLGGAFLKEGKSADARICFTEALRILPSSGIVTGYDKAYVEGVALNGLGVIENKRDNHDEAEAYFRKAILVDNEFLMARNNLGIALEQMGKIDEARASWLEVVGLSPSNRKARLCLALSFLRTGQYSEAKENFEAISSFGDDMMDGKLAYAWMLATCCDASVRDGKKAIGILLGSRSPNPVLAVKIHDVMAAGYADAGNFILATEHAEEALEIAEEVNVTGIEVIRRRLNLYRAKQPFREPHP
ncbi:MAG: tetratricopeptide repeat protein [Kiritimatiellae bacterium]|nr:tetratricopeptide repeat protein [Kiritimatiellia bacterium]